ncbi:hypothetical protein KTF56_03160 [Burkholderia gladioli]|uniref:hypothetical protein n=1 Tax=Burkholderia gladioli TaxID=28095 RepID=UPI001C22AB6E|nr:hypothetical protein [Burkholderia gladioli]MBU9681863.1 hypothetical protein [Burkholderia gladioli]
MRLPGLVKQEDVEIVSPEGELRCHVKGSFTGTMVLIADTSADVRVGDEIRRQLPNGKQEVFTVDDPKFYSSGPFGAHYQVKVSRPKVFDSHTGGHYSVNVSGSNARVNIHSNDHSVNLVSKEDVFSQMRQKVENELFASAERDMLLDAIDRLESAKHDKGAFARHYQGFITAAAAHMTVIAPFLPALGELLAKMHS